MYLTVKIGNKNSQMFSCYIMEYEITSSSNWSWVLREELLRRRCLGVFEDKNSSFGGEGMFLTTKTPPPENMNVFDYKNSFFIEEPCFCQQKVVVTNSNQLVKKFPHLSYFAFFFSHKNMFWCLWNILWLHIWTFVSMNFV